MHNSQTYKQELKNEVLKLLKSSTQDVFSIEQQKGQKLWVKKAKESGSSSLQRKAYKIFKNPLLTPSQKQTPKQSIRYEATRLQSIAKEFSHVPKVVISEDDFMILEDSGTDLRKLLKMQTDTNRAQTVIYKALDVLIEFHNLGFFHGGSQIKNFTLKDDKIYLIDFEEKFINADINNLQFRDLFLFLISIARLKHKLDYQKMIDFYIAKTSKNDFYSKFTKLSKNIKILMWILDKQFIYNFVGKDTQSIYRLFKQISS